MQELLGMKKLLILFGVLVFLTAGALPLSALSATVVPPPATTAPASATTPAPATPSAAATTAEPTSSDDSPSGVEKFASGAKMVIANTLLQPFDNLLKGLVQLTEIILIVMSIVLAFVGSLMNFVVNTTVVQMGRFVTSSDAVGVRIAWGIMRDLANIGIIGGLIATAIGTILHLPNINVQKWLVRLIIGALLINFSYFFAGAIIDSSNFVATKIYESVITTESCVDKTFFKCNIASRFMQIADYQKLRSPEQGIFNTTGLTVLSTLDHLVFNIFLIGFESTTIFLFLSVIGLLVGRFVALVFLIITSPVGIAAMAIPRVNKYAKEWWEDIFSQSFFAPVYFLLVGISLTILEGSKGALFSVNAVGLEALLGTMLTFIVATVFMQQSLTMAKGLSEQAKRLGDVYKAAGKWTNWMPNGYIGLTSWIGAVAARNTVGRVAERATYKFDEYIAKETRLGKFLMRTGADRVIKAQVLDKLADKKFGAYTDADGKKHEGFKGYETVKKEREAREIAIDEIKKDEERKKELADKRPALEKAQRNFQREFNDGFKPKTLKKGEIDPTTGQKLSKDRVETQDEFWNRQALRDHKIRKENGEMETDEEVLARTGLQKVKDKNGKMRWENLQELRARGGLDKAKIMVKDKDTGLDRLENDDEITLRIKQGVGKKKKGVNGAAADESNGDWGYYERLDNHFKSRELRGEAQSIVDVFSPEFLKREYRKDPKSLLQYSTLLSTPQFKALQDDHSIRHDIKDAMWGLRTGEFVGMIKDINKDVEDGKLIRGSEEYGRRILVPYNYQSKYLPNDELKALIKADHIGTGHDALTGAQLRAMPELWLGTSSTAAIEIKRDKLLSSTEQRKAGSMKRSPMTDMRDEYSLALLALGLGKNKNMVPEVGGTVEYDGVERGYKRRTSLMADRQKTIDLYEGAERAYGDGELSGVTVSTYKIAKRDRDFAEATLNKNLTLTSPDGKKTELSSIKNEAQRMRAIRDARKEYDKKIAAALVGKKTPQEKAEAIRGVVGSDPLNIIFDRMKMIEGGYDPNDPTGIPGWHDGKNDFEMGLLGKREAHTISTVFGVKDADRLTALFSGQDKAEKTAVWENMLMHGDDTFIANALTNPDIKKQFGWPNEERLAEINKIRRNWYGKNNLPSDPFTTEFVPGQASMNDNRDDGDDEDDDPDDGNDGGDNGNNPGGSSPDGGGQTIEPPTITRSEPIYEPQIIPNNSDVNVSGPDEADSEPEDAEEPSANMSLSGSQARMPGGQSDIDAPRLVGQTYTGTEPVASSLVNTSTDTPTAGNLVTPTTWEDHFRNIDPAARFTPQVLESTRKFMEGRTDEQWAQVPYEFIPNAVAAAPRASALRAIISKAQSRGDTTGLQYIRRTLQEFRRRPDVALSRDVQQFVDSDEFNTLLPPPTT
ncbi:MAG: hypothetical protein V4449_00685 [Patescibacteria group bacterium]